MIVVTGALGNVGASVVDELLARGAHVRAADLDPAAIAQRFGDGVEAAALEFTDPSTFDAVVAGAERAFLIRPPAISKVGPTLNAFIDHLHAEGAEHVVFSSVAGADTNRVVPHHRVESHLMDSGLAWTMLRPGFFAQNITGAYRRDIVEDDRIYVPAGDGSVAFIDAADIAAVAAVALTEDGHEGRGYHLTGSRAVTFDEMASILSDVVGRPIRYEAAPVLSYYRHLRRQGLVRPHALVQTILHVGLRRGDGAPVTDEVETLLGRPARSIEDFLAVHADDFR